MYTRKGRAIVRSISVFQHQYVANSTINQFPIFLTLTVRYKCEKLLAKPKTTTDNGDKNFQEKPVIKCKKKTWYYSTDKLFPQGNQNINTKHALIYNPVNIVNTSFGVCSFL